MAGSRSDTPKRRQGQKAVDALSASSIIAYIGTVDSISSFTKGTLLFLAPWMALILNTAIAVLGIYLRGFVELYSTNPVSSWLKRRAEATLADPSATQSEKQHAQATLDTVKETELRIYNEMRNRLTEFFGRP